MLSTVVDVVVVVVGVVVGVAVAGSPEEAAPEPSATVLVVSRGFEGTGAFALATATAFSNSAFWGDVRVAPWNISWTVSLAVSLAALIAGSLTASIALSMAASLARSTAFTIAVSTVVSIADCDGTERLASVLPRALRMVSALGPAFAFAAAVAVAAIGSSIIVASIAIAVAMGEYLAVKELGSTASGIESEEIGGVVAFEVVVVVPVAGSAVVEVVTIGAATVITG